MVLIQHRNQKKIHSIGDEMLRKYLEVYDTDSLAAEVKL